MCSWLRKSRKVNCQMWSPLWWSKIISLLLLLFLFKSNRYSLCYDLPLTLWFRDQFAPLWVKAAWSCLSDSTRCDILLFCYFPPGATFCYFVAERFYNVFLKFTGLVDNCEFGTGERETTAMDLTGFWEMIYIQVWVNCWDLLNRILTPDFPGGRCGRQVCEARQSWSRRVGWQRGQGGEESAEEENLARLESRSSSFFSTATNFPI